jgi:hypothetical protein
MSLTRQEVFQALADGKDIEVARAKERIPYSSIDTGYYSAMHPKHFSNYEWRIKPEPPKWYENIPEHGVLCWVGDNKPFVESTKIVNIIKMREVNQFISIRGARWNYALPLTNEEIKQFLQGE